MLLKKIPAIPHIGFRRRKKRSKSRLPPDLIDWHSNFGSCSQEIQHYDRPGIPIGDLKDAMKIGQWPIRKHDSVALLQEIRLGHVDAGLDIQLSAAELP